MKYSYYYITALLSVISCGDKEESGKIELFHSNIRLDTEYVGKGGDIISYKEGIIGIEEANLLAPLYKVDTVENKLTTFGVRGQGPDDFFHPYPLQYISEDKFGVYDMFLNTYKEVLMPGSDETVRIASSVKMETRPYRAIKTAYNQYLGLSGTEGLFSLMDETGKEIGVFFEYPYKDENEHSIKNHIRATAYQGILSSDPDGTKCVYASLDGEIIHFYEIVKDNVLAVRKIETVFPAYKPEENNGSMASRENMTGYIAVTATRDYVYALYCGKTVKELLKSGSLELSAKEVRVFDWKGNRQKTYSLDVPCRYISASEDDKKLWAIAYTPDIRLVSFQMTDRDREYPPEKNRQNPGVSSGQPCPGTNGSVSREEKNKANVINLGKISPGEEKEFTVPLRSKIISCSSTSKDIVLNDSMVDNYSVIHIRIRKQKTGTFADTVKVNFGTSEAQMVFTGEVR
jgi:hypothetical protein